MDLHVMYCHKNRKDIFNNVDMLNSCNNSECPSVNGKHRSI